MHGDLTPSSIGSLVGGRDLRSAGVAAIRPPANPFLEELLVKKTFVVPMLRQEAHLAVLTLTAVCSPYPQCVPQ